MDFFKLKTNGITKKMCQLWYFQKIQINLLNIFIFDNKNKPFPVE